MELKTQGSKHQENRIPRVRVEPELTGWAKLYDLIRQFDKDRVADVNECRGSYRREDGDKRLVKRQKHRRTQS